MFISMHLRHIEGKPGNEVTPGGGSSSEHPHLKQSGVFRGVMTQGGLQGVRVQGD